MIKLQVELKHDYGNNRIYLKDKAQAVMMERLTKTKALTTDNIEALKYFGFEFDVIQPTFDI